MTLKSLLSLVLAAAVTSPSVDARPVNSVCIKQSGMYGFTRDSSAMDWAELEGDLANVASMSLMKLAYSRPSKIAVCADDEYIHGIQFTLQLHEAEEGSYDNAGYDRATIEQMKKLDMMKNPESGAYYATTMALLGSQTRPCKDIFINDKDKLVFLETYTDGDRLRSLVFHMASEKKFGFGKNSAYDDNGMTKQLFNFSDKIDVLGVYGHVAPDLDDPSKKHIVSMAFIMNECPGRALLEDEREFLKMKGMLHLFEKDVEEAAHDETIALIVLITVLVGTCLTFCYFCLKNRGKICKKGGKGSAATAGGFREPGQEEAGGVPMNAV